MEGTCIILYCKSIQFLRLGIAIYDSQTAELCVTETWEDNDFENLQLIKFQTNPTTIITHSFYNCEKFGQAIKYKPGTSIPSSTRTKSFTEESNHSFEVKILKCNEFRLSCVLYNP